MTANDLLEAISPLEDMRPTSLSALQAQVARQRKEKQEQQERERRHKQLHERQVAKMTRARSDAERQRLAEAHAKREAEKEAALARAASRSRGANNGRGRGRGRGRGTIRTHSGRGGRNPQHPSPDVDEKVGNDGFSSDEVEDYEDFRSMRKAMKQRSHRTDPAASTARTGVVVQEHTYETPQLSRDAGNAASSAAHHVSTSSAGRAAAEKLGSDASQKPIQEATADKPAPGKKRGRKKKKNRKKINLGNFEEFMSEVVHVAEEAAPRIPETAQISNDANSNTSLPLASAEPAPKLPDATITNATGDETQSSKADIGDETPPSADVAAAPETTQAVPRYVSVEKMLAATAEASITKGVETLYDRRVSYDTPLPSLPPSMWTSLFPFAQSNEHAMDEATIMKATNVGVVIVRESQLPPDALYKIIARALQSITTPVESSGSSVHLVGLTMTCMEPPFERPSIHPPEVGSPGAERVLVMAFHVSGVSDPQLCAQTAMRALATSIPSATVSRAFEDGLVVACARLTAVQEFGGGDGAEDVSNQDSLSHPVHLLARLPAFTTYVAKSTPTSSAAPIESSVEAPLMETCPVVIHEPAFRKRNSLHHADDKDTALEAFLLAANLAGLDVVGCRVLYLPAAGALETPESIIPHPLRTDGESTMASTRAATTVLALRGVGAVARVAALLGPSDPMLAKAVAPFSIRARYSSPSSHAHHMISSCESRLDANAFVAWWFGRRVLPKHTNTPQKHREFVVPQPCPGPSIVSLSPQKAFVIVAPRFAPDSPGTLLHDGAVVGAVLKGFSYLGLQCSNVALTRTDPTVMEKLSLPVNGELQHVWVLVAEVSHTHRIGHHANNLAERYISDIVASSVDRGIVSTKLISTREHSSKSDVLQHAADLVRSGTNLPGDGDVRERWRLGQHQSTMRKRKAPLVTMTRERLHVGGKTSSTSGTSSQGFIRKGDGGVRLLFCAVHLSNVVTATPPDHSLSALGNAAHADGATANGDSDSRDAVSSIAFDVLKRTTRSAHSPLVELLTQFSIPRAKEEKGSVPKLHQRFEIVALKHVRGPISPVVAAELGRSAVKLSVADGGVAEQSAPTQRRGTGSSTDFIVMLLKTSGSGDEAEDLHLLQQRFGSTARFSWAHGAPDGACVLMALPCLCCTLFRVFPPLTLW